MIFIFDLFGVTLRWNSNEVLPYWARLAGVSVEQYKRETRADFEACECGKISMAELWERNGKKFGVKPSELKAIFLKRFVKRAKLNEAVVKIIKDAGKHGKVFLMSNQWPAHAEVCRKKGWFDVFDRVFLSFELGARKPDKAAYHAVLKRIRAKPGDCVLIDDKERNVKGAVSIGMHAILFKSARQLRRDLEKLFNLG